MPSSRSAAGPLLFVACITADERPVWEKKNSGIAATVFTTILMFVSDVYKPTRINAPCYRPSLSDIGCLDSNPVSSFMNMLISLNCRYTEAKRT